MNLAPARHSSAAQPGSREPKEPASQAGTIVPHSGHAQARSRAYHAQVVSPASQTRAVDQLNPSQTVPAHRSFPGLAN